MGIFMQKISQLVAKRNSIYTKKESWMLKNTGVMMVDLQKKGN